MQEVRAHAAAVQHDPFDTMPVGNGNLGLHMHRAHHGAPNGQLSHPENLATSKPKAAVKHVEGGTSRIGARSSPACSLLGLAASSYPVPCRLA